MSRALTIAREDFRRALGSRLVWGAIVLLGVMFLPSMGASARPEIHPIGEYLLLVPLDLMTFSLVVVAAVGYNAVVGERVAGTVRFVLGLPGTRRDFVVGKLLSRVGIVIVALTVILAVANALVFRGYGRPHVVPFWVMGGWMLLYVVVWSAVSVGYSAIFDSPYGSLGALVVTYVVFSPSVGVWRVLVRPLFAVVFTGSFDPPAYETLAAAPLWLRLTERVNPLVGFWQAMRWSVEVAGPGTPTGTVLPQVLGTIVFVTFGAIPLTVGMGRFARTDLGGEQPEFTFGDGLWRLLGRGWTSLRPSASPASSRTRAGRIRRLAVADVRHALQNWVVAGAMVVTTLLVVPNLWTTIDPSGIATSSDVLGDVALTFVLPVLVLGMAVGHNAVVGERTTGTVRLLLGAPITRRELVVGTLLSRVGVVSLTLVPLLLTAEALIVVRLGGPHIEAAVAWAGATVMFAAVWTSVAVGISAGVSSRYRSLAVLVATYLLFNPGVGLWTPAVRPAIAFAGSGHLSAEEFVTAADSPAWFRYADHVNPFVAFSTIQDGLLTATGYGTQHTELVVPLFVYSVAILGLFVAVTMVLGTRRFER